MSNLENFVGRVAGKLGLTVSRTSSLSERLPIEATARDRSIIEQVRPFTMTSSERIWSLLRAVDYLHANEIVGDFVECGVWRGGSVMAMALRLQQLGATDRKLWLYDTFQGMTPPTDRDVEAVGGVSADALLKNTAVGNGNNVWCVADLPDVQMNLAKTSYPEQLVNFVEGDVSQTLLEKSPDSISLLRLDTDWYDSTQKELEVLYPKLVPGGVCILDDYGHWLGARAAVDEYFSGQAVKPLMLPIDFSGRIFIKPGI
jgi:O-methyltransferase